MSKYDFGMEVQEKLKRMYDCYPKGTDETIDLFPEVINTRYQQAVEVEHSKRQGGSRNESLDSLWLLLARFDRTPAVAALLAQVTGFLLNKHDRLVYQENPTSENLYFDWRYMKDKVNSMMQWGAAPYQDLIRGAIELGMFEMRHKAADFARPKNPCFRRGWVRKPPALVLLKGGRPADPVAVDQ